MTPGDRARDLLANGPASCRVTFSTGSIEIGTVRHHEGGVWVLETDRSLHFFTFGEVLDVAAA